MNDYSKDIKSLETSYIIFVLKYATDEEHPLSAGEIALRMQKLTTEFHDTKTVLRKLRNMCILFEGAEEELELSARTLAMTYGGYVRSVSTTVSGDACNPKPQYKFYFEPFLMPSDVAMLCSSLDSNRYVAPSEKKHLQTTLQVLAPMRRIEDKEIQHYLPEEPTRHTLKKGRVKYIDLIDTVKLLYDAVRQKKRISVICGNYTLGTEQYRQISFEAKNSEKPYILNPYALFWNHGFFYLLATHGNHTNLVYFRVDRIVSAAYYRHEKPECMERAPIPESLKKYYSNYGTGAEQFDAVAFAAVHPLMAVSGKENLVECCLECDSTTLGLIVDTFGPVEILGDTIQIEESNILHTEDFCENSRADRYFTVRLPQVQYENIRAFCLQYHHLVTVVSPLMLAADLLKPLSFSLLKQVRVLESYVEGREEDINPFITTGNTLWSLANAVDS